MLWFIQHTSGGSARARRSTRVPRRLADGYEPVNRRSPTQSSPSSTTARRGRLLPRLPPVSRAAATCARRGPTPARALRAHPLARTTGRPAGGVRRAVHEGLLANDVVGFHTARWARNFRRAADEVDGRHRHDARHASRDLGRPGRVRRAGASGRRARRGASASSRRRPESSSCASTGPTRRRTSCAASRRSACLLERAPRVARVVCACSRCSTRRARRSPSTSSTSPRSSRRSSGVNERFDRGWRHRPAGRRQLPPVGGRLQAVRRAARERGLRRPEPRREGGAARQHARRRARALRERRRARGARRVGVSVNPFDIAGQAEALHQALDDAASRARRRAAGDQRARARARRRATGSPPSSPISAAAWRTSATGR